MKKYSLFFALLIASFAIRAQQVKWYLSMGAQQPWGTQTNINAMNQAFGNGGWNQGFYPSVNVNALLQPSVCLIFMEGGDSHANSMNNFLQTNIVAIQNWVAAGGRLLINAAPNQGGNIQYGFGGVLLNYAFGPYSSNSTNAPGQALHPIFNGPALPCGTNYNGNFWCHGYVTGPGITQLVIGQTPGCSLCEKAWGSGWVMFGSMTTPNWHTPTLNAANFLSNVLTYLAVCCQQPTITAVASQTAICSGQSVQITAGGAGVGGTYTINPGNITTSVITLQPASTTIFTIAGTNTANCQGSTTLQIIVNPTPTVNITSNSPVCRGSALNFNIGLPGGVPGYTWTGPNGFASNVQNPSIPNAQPANSGTYFVTVSSTYTNGGVCSSSGSAAAFVVNTNPVSTGNATVCQGSALTLTASVLGASSYSWTGPGNFSSQQMNPAPISPASPTNAGNYIVTAYFTTQGTTLVCTSTAVANTSVVATSPVTVTMPANICQYSTAVLTAASNPMAQNFSWSGPNGFNATGSNTTIPNILPPASGLYNVIATWAIGSVSCNVSGANQLNVVPVPNVNINPPVSVCYPANVQLSANSPGAISYNWTATNGYTSNVANPLLTAPDQTLSGIYTVNTAYTNGALTCYNSNTTQVTINPILTFTLPTYEQKCFNSTYTVAGPSGATSYTWQGMNGYTSNNQNLVIPNITPAQGGTYTLSVNLGPCITSAVTKIDVLSPISYSSTPGNRIICAGETVTLTMGASGGSHNYAYNWDPAIYLPSPTGSVQVSQPQGTTIYNVSAYDINCPFYTVTTTFTVQVNKAPMPDLQLEKAEGCEPLCLTYNSHKQNEIDNITWDFGNGQLLQGDDFSHCLTVGQYDLKVTTKGKNGCTETYTQAPIKVWPKPHTDFTWDPEQPSTTDNRVTFWPSHQYGPVTSYYWQFSGTNHTIGMDSSAAKNPLRIYENVGKYPVMVIAKTDKGCIDTTFKVLEVREDFTVFIPNTFTPNGDGLNDIFNIKGLGLKTEGYSMDIFDRWGALIYSTKDALKGWDGTIKGLNAANGVYVYKVKAVGANGEGRKEYVGHVTLMR